MSRADRARGLMHGQLVTGLEIARTALGLARRGESTLSSEDRERLHAAIETLRGLEQRAWTAR